MTAAVGCRFSGGSSVIHVSRCTPTGCGATGPARSAAVACPLAMRHCRSRSSRAATAANSRRSSASCRRSSTFLRSAASCRRCGGQAGRKVQFGDRAQAWEAIQKGGGSQQAEQAQQHPVGAAGRQRNTRLPALPGPGPPTRPAPEPLPVAPWRRQRQPGKRRAPWGGRTCPDG